MGDNNCSFSEALNHDILAYAANPSERTYGRILCRVFDGIEQNGSIPVSADMDWDTMKIQPTFYSNDDCKKSLVALTDPGGEKYPFFAAVKLRAVLRIMMNDADCDGIIFNPEEGTQVFIMKGIFLNAFGAVIALIEDESEQKVN